MSTPNESMDSAQTHGLSVGIETQGSEVVVTLKAIGTLTHDDYRLFVPMLERALEAIEHPRIRALIDATELRGWAARAAWDDFKLGLKHGREFQRIAIVGNRQWQETAAKVGSWFIAGEARYFENDWQAARSWLNRPEGS